MPENMPEHLILIHGAWAGGWVWERLLAPLRAAGFRPHALELPGNGHGPRGHLDAGLDDVCFYGIFDPAAVQEMEAAGVGATLTLSLGGKMDMPAIGLTGEPLELEGTVLTL